MAMNYYFSFIAVGEYIIYKPFSAYISNLFCFEEYQTIYYNYNMEPSDTDCPESDQKKVCLIFFTSVI